MKTAHIDKLTKEQIEEAVKKSTSWNELNFNLGYKSKFNSSRKNTIMDRLQKYNISIDHFTSSHVAKSRVRGVENTLIENTTAADNTVREYYKRGNYTPYVCSICGQEPFWNGKPLILTLDHINGNHFDSRIENLRWVCPNCDRQLDTFAGRNHYKYDK